MTMAELLDKFGSKVPSLRRNQEVTGKIIAVSGSEILVDIGAKSEGIIVGRELIEAVDVVSKLSVGDSIDATVIYPENDSGQVVLSLRKLSMDARWAELEEKKETDEEIGVMATEANRGGVICEWQQIRGFLPASQLTKTPANLSDLIGKRISARVIEVDRKSDRLILSQKGQDTRDLVEIKKLLAKVEIGQRLEGMVTAVLPFGVFVEVGIKELKSKRVKELKDEEKVEKEGKTPDSSVTSVTSKLEGLVHISEISWEKVEDPDKFFKVSDKVDVVVIAKEEATGRLNLSIKQLSADPFLEISKNYTKDQEVSGNVARITPYGVFVTIAAGLEGLIHISKIPPNVEYKVGEAVSSTVEAVDTRARRISLVPIAKEKPVLYR